MANDKQRRRKAKEKRHAYDLVEIDGEGNETVLTSSELKTADPPKKKVATKSAPRGRGLRGEPHPPSWTRVLKRGAIAAPAFFVLVMLLGKLTPAQAILQTGFLLVLFIPFSYVLDGFIYRSYLKRLSKSKSR